MVHDTKTTSRVINAWSQEKVTLGHVVSVVQVSKTVSKGTEAGSFCPENKR